MSRGEPWLARVAQASITALIVTPSGMTVCVMPSSPSCSALARRRATESISKASRQLVHLHLHGERTLRPAELAEGAAGNGGGVVVRVGIEGDFGPTHSRQAKRDLSRHVFFSTERAANGEIDNAYLLLGQPQHAGDLLTVFASPLAAGFDDDPALVVDVGRARFGLQIGELLDECTLDQTRYTGPALAFGAAFFGAGEAGLVAEPIKQRTVALALVMISPLTCTEMGVESSMTTRPLVGSEAGRRRGQYLGCMGVSDGVECAPNQGCNGGEPGRDGVVDGTGGG